MAVDEGYDRVAFTTGKQQAERYNLAKYVDSVLYNETDKTLIAYNDKGNAVINKSGIKPEDLEDYIGKDAAKKLVEKDYEPITMKGAENIKVKRLENADLEIGGEGMKGFYDKILPEYVNKYGKKYGIKVGKTNLNREPSTFTFDDYKKYYNETDPSLDNSFVRFAWDNKDQDMMDKFLEGMSAKKGDEVHYFDITPEAKKSLLEKGSPLFAIPPAVEMTDEESRKEMLERLFKENQK
jgi:hypothetical protein